MEVSQCSGILHTWPWLLRCWCFGADHRKVGSWGSGLYPCPCADSWLDLLLCLLQPISGFPALRKEDTLFRSGIQCCLTSASGVSFYLSTISYLSSISYPSCIRRQYL